MPRRTQRCRPVLAMFMSWKDNTNHSPDCVFTNDDLHVMFPDHIVKWFNVRACGKENPDQDAGDCPTLKGSSGLEADKQALSFFMPNQGMKWNIDEERVRILGLDGKHESQASPI